MVGWFKKWNPPWGDLTSLLVCIVWLDGIRWLFLEDRYRTFLQPGFRYLLYTAAGVYLLYLLVFVLGRTGSSRPGFRLSTIVHGLIVLSPLLFMYAAEGTGLGSHALAMKQLEGSRNPFSALLDPDPSQPPPDTEGELTILDLVQHQDRLDGSRVMVRGGIFKDDRYPADLLVLFRFTMLCCAADAMPMGILVRPDDDAPAMENDDWVRIEGILRKIPVNGEPHPVIEDARIEVLPPPPPGERYLPLL